MMIRNAPSTVRLLAGAVAMVSLGSPLPMTAHAADADWVVVSTFTAPEATVDLSAVTAQVDAAVALVSKARKSCVPSTTVAPERLSGQTLRNTTNGQIAYRWFGPGTAMATKDCASRVTVKVIVTDVSPTGSPIQVRGPAYSAYNNANTTRAWGAHAQSLKPDVLYFDPLTGYVRGLRTHVYVSVSASYVDAATGKTIPLPCQEASTEITPTPDGPVFGGVVYGPCSANKQ
jgi:hypothetical protein